MPPRNKLQAMPTIFMKSLAVARMMEKAAAEQNSPELEVVKAAPVPAKAEVSEMVPVKAAPVPPAAKMEMKKEKNAPAKVKAPLVPAKVVPAKVKAPLVPAKVKAPSKAKVPPKVKVPPKAKVSPKAKVAAKTSLKVPKGSVALMEAKQLLKRVTEMQVALEGAVNALKHKAAAERLDKIRKKAKSPMLQERFRKIMEAAGGDVEEAFSSDLEEGSMASSAWEGYEETEVPSLSGDEYSLVEIEEELAMEQKTILDLFDCNVPTVDEFMSWRDGLFGD